MRRTCSVYHASMSRQESMAAIQLDCVYREVANVLFLSEFPIRIKFEPETWPCRMQFDTLDDLCSSVSAQQNFSHAQQGAIAICSVSHAVRNSGAATRSSTSTKTGSAASE